MTDDSGDLLRLSFQAFGSATPGDLHDARARLASHHNSVRSAQQVSIIELDARAHLWAIVDHALTLAEQHRYLFRDRRRPIGILLGDDDVVEVGRDGLWPADPALVVALLDDGLHQASGSDAITAHPRNLLAAVLLREDNPQLLGVATLKHENVPDLDASARS